MDKALSFLQSLGKGFIIFLIIGVGLYPLMYVLADSPISIIDGKGALGEHPLWLIAFYLHILFGGAALLLGWPQFISSWRSKYLARHRKLGKLYIISILFFSAPSGFYLSLYAFGETANKVGFGLLAIFWFITTLQAFLTVRRKDILAHREWMIRSYALSLAAVTLRLYMPFMQAVLLWSFDFSYSLIAWICWIPNLLIAEWLVFTSKANLRATT
ncbi:MAG: DUF2306 domain-containing protein [Bacteroidota bacterium]